MEKGKETQQIRRRRKLDATLYGLAFDEKQLQALAERIRGCAAELRGGRLTVSIDSATRGETYEIEDNLELLKNPGLPRAVGSVDISLITNDSRLTCFIHINSNSARLSVQGEDALHARALFTELEEGLNRRVYEFCWLARWIKRPLGNFVTYVIAYLLVMAALLFAVWPFLSSVANALAFGLLCAIIATVTALAFVSQLEKAFPGVRFGGYFFDSSYRSRRVLYFLTSSVVLPILLRVAYDHARH